MATDNDGVRSIGVIEDKAVGYSSDNFKLWFKGNTAIKGTNMFWYDEDYLKMRYYEIFDLEDFVMLASRMVLEYDDNISFYVPGLDKGAGGVGRVFKVTNTGEIDTRKCV